MTHLTIDQALARRDDQTWSLYAMDGTYIPHLGTLDEALEDADSPGGIVTLYAPIEAPDVDDVAEDIRSWIEETVNEAPIGIGNSWVYFGAPDPGYEIPVFDPSDRVTAAIKALAAALLEDADGADWLEESATIQVTAELLAALREVTP